MLSLPRQISCKDFAPGGAYNATHGDPSQWLDEGDLAAHDLAPLTFDFFVNWNDDTIPDEIWLKTILDIGRARARLTDPRQLLPELDAFNKQNRPDYEPFLAHTGLQLVHKLIPDRARWDARFEAHRNQAALYSVRDGIVEQHMLPKVMAEILRLRGGAGTRTTKRLYYAASSIECYLSTTDVLWPGDADAVLVDHQGQPVAVLEYKKCTRPPPVADQTLEMWARDVRKWQSLGLLREKLGGDKRLPAIIVFYSTTEDDHEVKLELLQGPSQALTVRRVQRVQRPILGQPATSADYVTAVTDLIRWAQQNREP